MSISSESGGATPDLVARVKGILLKPDAEWSIIDAEQATTASLYRNYVVILAAIGPVAAFLRSELFGYRLLAISYRPPLINALAQAIVGYVLTLVGVYVFALIVDALAPTFQGQKSQIQALKLVAYASTASWLAGVFSLVPALSPLALLGLYSLYLFYRGVPVMMKSPQEKSLPYTAVIIVIAVLIAIAIAPLSMLLTGGRIPV